MTTGENIEPILSNNLDIDNAKDDDEEDGSESDTEDRLDSENDKEEQHIEIAVSCYQVRADSSMADSQEQLGEPEQLAEQEQLGEPEQLGEQQQAAAVQKEQPADDHGGDQHAEVEQAASQESEAIGSAEAAISPQKEREAAAGRSEDRDAKYNLLIKTLRYI